MSDPTVRTAALSDLMLHLDGDEPLTISSGQASDMVSLRGATHPLSHALERVLTNFPDNHQGNVTIFQSVRLLGELLQEGSLTDAQLDTLAERTDLSRADLDQQLQHCLELWDAAQFSLGRRPTVLDLIIHTAEEYLTGTSGVLELPADWQG